MRKIDPSGRDSRESRGNVLAQHGRLLPLPDMQHFHDQPPVHLEEWSHLLFEGVRRDAPQGLKHLHIAPLLIFLLQVNNNEQTGHFLRLNSGRAVP